MPADLIERAVEDAGGRLVRTNVGDRYVVEAMRKGMHPKDACVYAARNIVRLTRAKHLVRKDGKPNFNVKFYAVDKKGRHGGAAIWSGGKYAAFDADGNRRIDFAYALER